MTISFHTLPLEIVYRIIHHLSDEDLFLAASNVCQRVNLIIQCYLRYQVNHFFKIEIHFLILCRQ